MMRTYLFSSLLAFIGIAISLASNLIEKKWLKRLCLISAVIVILISALWFGYERGVAENKDVGDKIESLEKTKKELLANIHTKEEENVKLRETLNEKINENQLNRSELAKSNEQIRSLGNQLNDLENKIKNIEITKDNEIINLKKQLSKMEQQVEKQKIVTDHEKGGIINEGKHSKEIEQSNSKSFFENNVLNIEVVSFKELGPYFNLALKHTNKTQEPIIIRAFEHRRDTFLIDDHSNQYNYIYPYKVGRGNDLTLSDRGSTIELVPGIPRIISFQFSCHTKSYGKIFTFSSKYGYCINKGFAPLPHNPMYVSIKGIKLE